MNAVATKYRGVQEMLQGGYRRGSFRDFSSCQKLCRNFCITVWEVLI